jgi:type I restriction enzyme S subunit
MIEGLKPYAEYKESGLNWLGQIPVSWETPRTKTRFRLSMEKSGIDHDKELLSVYTRIGVRPRKDLEQRGNKASTTNDYWVVRQGDIIVNKLLAWMGAVGVSHFDGVTSPAYDILRPVQKLEPDFYHLLFRTKLYLQLFKSRSRGIMDMRLRLYFDQLGQIPLICPPPDEQAAIVHFLDHANRKIDGFIRAKGKLIGLLNEQKQAIIHRAVTRGIHPDIPLQPSGVPWLGDIPAHWEVRKLLTVADMIVSNVDKHSKPNEQRVRLCNYTDVYKNEVITNALNFMVASATKDEIMKFKIRIDDVIVTKDSEEWDDIGVPSLVRHEADDLLCGYHLAMLRPRKQTLHGEFLLRCLQDRFVATQLHVRATGVTRYGLSHQGLKEVLLPIPNTGEQVAICAALTKNLSTFNTAIARAEREIALMQEYRTRLTADIVTGKLDVGEAAAKLPDLPAEGPLEPVADQGDVLEEVEIENE